MCCVCNVLGDAVCFVCCLCVCVCLIGARVRVRLCCYTGVFVFVWCVYDMVCDGVSLFLFVLCVFVFYVCFCGLCCFYTHVNADCDVLRGAACVGFMFVFGDRVRALYMCASV